MSFPFKRGKYGAKKTVVDGIVFDSKKEAKYYERLKELRDQKVVNSIEMQVPFELQPKFRHKSCKRVQLPIVYLADFVVEYADGHTEVVDVKGFRTKEYRIKKKMLLYLNPDINFIET